jgi:hypothetical protein
VVALVSGHRCRVFRSWERLALKAADGIGRFDDESR